MRPPPADGDRPWRLGAACVIVRVRLTPKSSKDAIDGLESTPEGAALKARVRAVPEDGKANTAVAHLLAEWLGVPRSTAEVTGGAKSRVKSVTIRGGDTAQLQRLLEDRIAALAAPPRGPLR